jgi:hypothetical protein
MNDRQKTRFIRALLDFKGLGYITPQKALEAMGRQNPLRALYNTVRQGTQGYPRTDKYELLMLQAWDLYKDLLSLNEGTQDGGILDTAHTANIRRSQNDVAKGATLASNELFGGTLDLGDLDEDDDP